MAKSGASNTAAAASPPSASPPRLKHATTPNASSLPHSSPNSSPPAASAAARKREQAAQKAWLNALSKNLVTRLRYASFKVEHGWKQQTLFEVENLYYRQKRSGLGQHTSPGHRPTESTAAPQHSGRAEAGSHLSTPKIGSASNGSGSSQYAVRHGLSTPPTTGGSLPRGFSYASGEGGGGSSGIGTASRPNGREPVTPRSPFTQPYPGSSSATSSAAAVNGSTAAAPSLGSASSGSRVGPASASSGSAGTYADFWSKMGTSTISSGSAMPRSAAANAGVPSSPATASRKRTFGSGPSAPAIETSTSPFDAFGGGESPAKRPRVGTATNDGAAAATDVTTMGTTGTSEQARPKGSPPSASPAHVNVREGDGHEPSQEVHAG